MRDHESLPFSILALIAHPAVTDVGCKHAIRGDKHEDDRSIEITCRKRLIDVLNETMFPALQFSESYLILCIGDLCLKFGKSRLLRRLVLWSLLCCLSSDYAFHCKENLTYFDIPLQF